MKVPSVIKKLCLPAKVYLFLSLISIILYLVSMFNAHETIQKADPEEKGLHNYTLGGLGVKVLFTIFWIYVLNYICQFKYGKKIAWFIVLLPFFFMGLMLIGLMCALSFIAIQGEKKESLQKELNSERKMNGDQKKTGNSQNTQGVNFQSDLLKQ